MRSSRLYIAGLFLAAFGLISCDSATPPEPAPPPPPAVPPPEPPPPPPPPAPPGVLSMAITSGDQQKGTVDDKLGNPLVVTVTRAGTGAEKDQAVTFRVTAGGGSVSSATVTTGADGVAQTTWTIGTRAGESQNVEVRAVDHVSGATVPSVSFSATAAAGAPSALAVTAGKEVEADAGTAVDEKPAVKLKDRFGNSTPGISVKFAATSGNGTVSGPDAVTNSDGVATVGKWVVGQQPGEQTLTATASGSGISGNPASFKATVVCHDCWTSLAPADPRSGGEVTVAQGRLYFIGGDIRFPVSAGEVQMYDAASNSWSRKADMPTHRISFGAATINGIIYVAGGQTGYDPLGTLEAYDPATDRWTAKAPMPTPRKFVGVFDLGGLLYVVGGIESNSETSRAVEVYDPANNSWTIKNPLPIDGYGMAVVAARGTIYLLGGQAGAGDYTSRVLEYDRTSDSWTQKKFMPVATGGSPGAASLGDLIYFIGGATDGYTSQNLAYDPRNDTWSNRASMPTARGGPGVVGLGKLIYVVGGSTASGPTGVLEAYRP